MKSLYRYICMLLVIFVIGGCTNNFEQLNTNPLALTADKVDASLIGLAFAQTQYNTMNGVHWRFQISQNLFADLFCQYFATTHPNFDSDRYTQVGRWSDLAWTSFYGQAAPNIKFVEDFTGENGLTVQNAVAKIWRVMGYHRITDYWGPVPYSQFGNGETTVAYDDQESIYRNFFTTLDEAVSVLKSNMDGNAFGSNDLVYSGDAAKWLTFANSLRLRLAMRVKHVDPALAKSEAEKAVSDGVMISNDDNAYVQTTSTSPNPINTITNWGEYRMSATMESVLKGYEDPRTGTYFNPAVDGDRADDPDDFPYEGMRNGQSKIQLNDSKNLDHSDVGDHFQPSNITGNPPIVVMRAAEVFFLRAEGALEGWSMGGDAKDLYEEGIRMSITEWTATSGADIDTYIAGTNPPADPDDSSPAVTDIPVAFDGGGSMERQLEQIITQKWLALYPDGWEAWAELRRTGYPKTFPRLNSDNPDVGVNDVMSRMVYVTSEFDNNPQGVQGGISTSEIGGNDKGNVKVWWDKK